MPNYNAENEEPQSTPSRSTATPRRPNTKAGPAVTPTLQQPFSFKLAKSKQCIEGVLYKLREGTVEYEFFHTRVVTTLHSILDQNNVHLHGGDNVLPALADIIKEDLPDALLLDSMEVPMLAKTDEPYEDNPHPDEFYTTSDDFTLLPYHLEFPDSTNVFKLRKTLQSYKFKIVLHFTLAEYRCQLKLNMHPETRGDTATLTLQQDESDVCMTTNGDKRLMLKHSTAIALFKPDSWRVPRRTDSSPRTEPRALGEDVRLEKSFEEDEEGTHLVKMRKDEQENIKILNATLHDFCSIIQIPTPSGEVTTLERMILKTPRTEQTAHLPENIATGDMQQPEPGDYDSASHYVEILLDKSKCKSQGSVASHFQNQWPHFTANMKPEVLCTLLQFWHEKSSPRVQEAVTKWGLQEDNNTWIFSNCTFKTGSQPVPIDHHHHFVHKACFNNSKSVQFPVLTQCSYTAARYCMANWLFNDGFDYKCGKNAFGARFVFSLALVAVRAGQFWEGSANEVSGVPIAWTVSPKANSGKTTVLNVLSALFGKRCALLSCTSTKVALLEHCQRDSHLGVLVDDVTKTEAREKMYEEYTRMSYDRTSYDCYQKSRDINCMTFVSSNTEFNIKSAPDQQRKIVVHMNEAVRTKRNERAADFWRQLITEKRLSCLLPDFCTLGGAKLQKPAMQDCCLYLCELLTQTRGTKNRVAMLWGTALYCNMLLLVALNLQELIAPTFELPLPGARREGSLHHGVRPGTSQESGRHESQREENRLPPRAQLPLQRH